MLRPAKDGSSPRSGARASRVSTGAAPTTGRRSLAFRALCPAARRTTARAPAPRASQAGLTGRCGIRAVGFRTGRAARRGAAAYPIAGGEVARRSPSPDWGAQGRAKNGQAANAGPMAKTAKAGRTTVSTHLGRGPCSTQARGATTGALGLSRGTATADPTRTGPGCPGTNGGRPGQVTSPTTAFHRSAVARSGAGLGTQTPGEPAAALASAPAAVVTKDGGSAGRALGCSRSVPSPRRAGSDPGVC